MIRRNRLIAFIGIGLLVLSNAMHSRVNCSAGEIQFLAAGELAADAKDLSGLTEELAPGVTQDRLGGFSALEYSGSGDLYYALPDRGPADGAYPYQCRVQQLELRLDVPAKKVKVSLQKTVPLMNAPSDPYVGAAAAIGQSGKRGGQRLDPEGFRVGPGGEWLISDEYGPYLIEFSGQGMRRRSLTVPELFRISSPAASPLEEASRNSSGRQPNRGLEGLAIAPSGKFLVGAMQGPLIQDSRPEKAPKRSGHFVRLLKQPLNDGMASQFVYRLERPSLGISEILAISDHEYLVLERDGEPGLDAKVKQIWKIDIRDASDVSQIAKLPPDQLPPEIRTVTKTLFLDLLNPKCGLAGPNFPEKVEGLTFGPTLPAGDRLLLVAVDNDFRDDRATWIWAFSVPQTLLPGFGWRY